MAAPPIRFEEVAAQAGLKFTLRNAAAGGFHQIELTGGGVAVIDYNNDGCADVFFANGAAIPSLKKTGPEFSNRLFRNNCDLTFTDVTAEAGLAGEGYSMAVAVGDFDNDGYADLFVTGVKGNTLYRNLGNGKFVDVTAKAGVGAGKVWSVSAGWVDYDNDGRVDAVVSVLNGPAKLFRNVTATDAHWLAVRLRGVRSNRMGLGAKIQVHLADGRDLYNQATTAVGYASSSEALVRFGLGQSRAAEWVEVTWPGGEKQQIAGVKGDRIVEIRQ